MMEELIFTSIRREANCDHRLDYKRNNDGQWILTHADGEREKDTYIIEDKDEIDQKVQKIIDWARELHND